MGGVPPAEEAPPAEGDHDGSAARVQSSGRFCDGVSISVEMVQGTDRPAMKPLRYRAGRATEQRLLKWGLKTGMLHVSRFQPAPFRSLVASAQGGLRRRRFHRNRYSTDLARPLLLPFSSPLAARCSPSPPIYQFPIFALRPHPYRATAHRAE